MAEDEIIKHTKAAYKAWKNPDASISHKLKEILVEIIIIVFAVTISIWLHNWSDSVQDRKQEKIFLQGIREDIANNMSDLDSNIAFYKYELNGLNYFALVGSGALFSKDSLEKYVSVFFSSTEFDPQISRYEALKGSGKFSIIENLKLLDTIIDLHEQTFVHAASLGKIYYNYNAEHVLPFINANLQLSPEGKIANAEQMLKNSQMRFFIMYDKGLIQSNILQTYTEAISECNGVIKEIDTELK